MISDLFMFFIGIVPIVWLFFALCILRLPGHIACPGGLLIAAALAFFTMSMRMPDLATAALEGLIFALWPILLVIVSAMILYKYSVETGGMETIKMLLTGISRDRRILVLIIAWGFGSFLEGIAGFGVPVLIPGAILVSLGFNPMFSIVACLVANSVPTPFATLGIPVTTLAGVTGIDAGILGYNTALQLIIPCLIMPFFLVMLAGGGVRAIKGVGSITLIAGLSLAVPMLLVTRFAGPELPALLGSVCTIGCIAFANKRLYKDNAQNRQYHLDTSPSSVISTANLNILPGGGQGKPVMGVFQACLPFAIVLILLLVTRLIGPVYEILSRIRADMIVYTGPDAYVLSFTFLLTPGILILISVLLSSVIQGFKLSALWTILKTSFSESRNMAITIISIVAMAKIMDYSGMTDSIALMLIAVFSVFYPLIAPVIGMFGVFITGSNTTCAILFGNLQAGAARAIGVNPSWIVSSNMSAAALGKMISPQSIAIGLRIGGLDGKEGAIIRQTLKYSLFCVAIVCLITYIFV
jgi:lactate permease